MDKEYCLIEKSELELLLTAYHRLSCLECDGVDNWMGYMEGKQEYIEEALSEIDPNYQFTGEDQFEDIVEFEIKGYTTISKEEDVAYVFKGI